MGPIAADTDTVIHQIDELKNLKEVVHPKQLEIQTLNHTAKDLLRESPTEQHPVIKEPVTNVNKRWDILLDKIGTRDVKLKKALLSLGQFHSAIDEMLEWLDRTERSVDDLEPPGGDPKIIEIELSKLGVCFKEMFLDALFTIITQYNISHSISFLFVFLL